MIVETAVGQLRAVAVKDNPNQLLVSSDRRETINSMLDGIELIGGAESEDLDFDRGAIRVYTPPFKPASEHWFGYTVTKTQFVRYLQYEVLNFLDYTSVTQMRKL